MRVRWMRALALAAVVAFGWSGVAAAQTQTYNFSFSANGMNGSGQITTQSASSFLVTAARIVFSGTTYNLDTSGGCNNCVYGVQPTLSSKTAGSLFSTDVNASYGVYVRQTAGTNNTKYLAFNHYQSATDQVDVFGDGGSYVGTYALSSERFVPAPAPAPGAGLASWLITALAAAGVYGRTWMRKRRGVEPAAA